MTCWFTIVFLVYSIWFYLILFDSIWFHWLLFIYLTYFIIVRQDHCKNSFKGFFIYFYSKLLSVYAVNSQSYVMYMRLNSQYPSPNSIYELDLSSHWISFSSLAIRLVTYLRWSSLVFNVNLTMYINLGVFVISRMLCANLWYHSALS